MCNLFETILFAQFTAKASPFSRHPPCLLVFTTNRARIRIRAFTPMHFSPTSHNYSILFISNWCSSLLSRPKSTLRLAPDGPHRNSPCAPSAKLQSQPRLGIICSVLNCTNKHENRRKQICKKLLALSPNTRTEELRAASESRLMKVCARQTISDEERKNSTFEKQ